MVDIYIMTARIAERKVDGGRGEGEGWEGSRMQGGHIHYSMLK